MSKLADLMVKLSLDPALRRQFQDDPSALMDEAGLSEEEMDLVAGGNPERIRAFLGGDAPTACFVLFVRDDQETPQPGAGNPKPL